MYKYRKIVFAALPAILIILDQLSKYIIRTNGGFYICNKHFAFGLTANYISIILIIFLFIIILNSKFKIFNLTLIKITYIPLILLVAGAISNIIDRIMFGCVIDFIDLKFWPVFNLADIYITVGIFIVIIKMLLKNKI